MYIDDLDYWLAQQPVNEFKTRGRMQRSQRPRRQNYVQQTPGAVADSIRAATAGFMRQYADLGQFFQEMEQAEQQRQQARRDPKAAISKQVQRYVDANEVASNKARQRQLKKMGLYTGNIDGKWGPLSKDAHKQALNIGYVYNGVKYVPHTSKDDLDVILNHKSRYNVQDPYVVIDKNNKTMRFFRGDKELDRHEVVTGAVKGDGYQVLRDAHSYHELPRTTPAGVFTAHLLQKSPYNNEPLAFLYRDGANTRVAIHSPARPERHSAIYNGTLADNLATQGCISPQYEVMRQLFGNGMFHEGDSIYVLPEMPGNYMAEQDGKITTVFGGDNPQQFVNNYGFIGDFLYNTSR